MIAFTARVLALRNLTHPLGNHWYSGLPTANGLADLAWLRSSSEVMHVSDWNDTTDGVLGCLIGRPGRANMPLLLLVNPHASDRDFVLPPGQWRALLDTAQDAHFTGWHRSGSYPLAAHSLVLLAAS